MKKLLIVSTLSLLLAIAGCAERVAVAPTPTLPAAMGQAKVSRDSSGNSKVSLNVEHVAPPQNLQPPKSVYVVWVETPEKQTFNLGQLKISKDRKGSISGITPFKTFRLVVTAEDFPTVTTPSSQEVLRTDILEAK